MKIGVITIHYANSYGGVLQAYATQKILSYYGDVEIINYQKKHLADGLRVIRWGTRPMDVLRVGKDLLRYVPRKKLVMKFKSFIEENLNCTKKIGTQSELRVHSEKYHILVVGSDQVWNPNIVGGPDKNFLLEFSNSKNKISFSSSYGGYAFEESQLGELISILEKFRRIAVREQSSCKQLQSKLPSHEIKVTLDPTLLLNPTEWLKFTTTKKPFDNNYILVYLLGSDGLLSETVKLIKELSGLAIITINQDPYVGFKSDLHIRDAGPSDFVNYFRHAEFVITNSFHGTVFSINFEKEFITLPPGSGANRITDLLKELNLSNRYVSQISQVSTTAKKKIDYLPVNEKLTEMRNLSNEFLKEAIESCVPNNEA